MEKQSVQIIIDQARDLHKDAFDLLQKLNVIFGFPEIQDFSFPVVRSGRHLQSALSDFTAHDGFYASLKQSGDACRHPVQSPDVLGQGGN